MQLLVYTDNNDRTLGRALYWTFQGFKIVDRVFYVTDEIEFLFRNWAKENGAWFRIDRDKFINPETGECEYKNFSFSVRCHDGPYPYVDTFTYYDQYAGVMSNVNNGGLVLESTDGGWEGGGTRCEGCDCPISEDEAIYVDDYGDCCSDCATWDDHDQRSILQDQSIQLHNCQITHQDNAVYSSRLGEYYLSDEAIYCEDIDDYVPSEDAVHDVWDAEDIFGENAVYSDYHCGHIKSADAVYSKAMGDHLHKDAAEYDDEENDYRIK